MRTHTIKRIPGAAVLLSLLSAGLSAQPPTTASISGILKTEDGKFVTATVRLRSKTFPALHSSIAVSASGAFTLTGLPAGAHELCASVPSDPYIDPCEWTSAGFPISLQAGQALTGVTFTVKKASAVRVHINDSGKLLTNSTKAALFMGVLAPSGRFFPAVLKNSGSTGNDYQLQVPFDTPFYLSVLPVGLSVTDGNNNDVSGGKTIAQQYPSSGPTPAVLTFTINGAK